MQAELSQTITAAEFWKVLSKRPIGATLVAAGVENRRVGLIALSAAHVSANPARMLFSVSSDAPALPGIREQGAFSINFLSGEQSNLYQAFIARDSESKARRFGGPDWICGKIGVPVVKGAAGAFECVLEQEIPLDNVYIIIGQVVSAYCSETADALTQFSGRNIIVKLP